MIELKPEFIETKNVRNFHVMVDDLVSVGEGYLGDVLLGRRPISPQMAERLGWVKVEVFVQKK